ncbi:methylthioribose-1-phosphate isomerase [Athalassotoga saccharophila]|nr:S-methyl-5-thioribose-1-phosphate isomerase [Athalassotoga saccharophila]BBJ28490.1 methylthioribose-1-phosphate isomerase [Athalassotoga saccharophila]
MISTLTMKWDGRSISLIDQRKLPQVEEYVKCESSDCVALAIKDMVVRGAPAIGATAAFGYVIGAIENKDDLCVEKMNKIKEKLAKTRPTAVNLFWALERMHSKFLSLKGDPDYVIRSLNDEAERIANEDIAVNKKMGEYGQSLLPSNATVITHCNAGALATVDYGTAIGMIHAALDHGKVISAYVDETRPYLQGSRLTAWELMKLGVKTTLICDNMAGWVMKTKKVDAVIVGADRIASNGDVANKIGTYSLALLAKRHNVKFYVVAPISTIDLNIKSGSEIPIEERSHDEVTSIKGIRIAPDGVGVYNPAFDVTDASLVDAIVTERGVIFPPYDGKIEKVVRGG